MSPHTVTEPNQDQGRGTVHLPGPDLDDAVRVFVAERTRLLRVAYRVVGDSAAAEDVVQETWVRWQRVDRRGIKNPAAFLTTATTHLAINLIQSARHRHELPAELPLAPVGSADDPTVHIERAAAIERMLAFLMAKLSRVELAALLLRKCFDLDYQEVADFLGTTAPNARQLVRRAHVAITSSRIRRVEVEQHRRLVTAFGLAMEVGDLSGLIDLLIDHGARCSRQGAGRTRRTAGLSRRDPVPGRAG